VLIASLGSSFAAGPGIPPIVERAAGRSGSNYAHLLAERLGARLIDLTVSGATTQTVLRETQRVGRRVFPPQIRGVPPDSDLVTVTVGGNDLGFAASVLAAAIATRRARRTITRPFAASMLRRVAPGHADADVARAAAGLAEIAAAVRDRAQNARVVLVDYVTIFGDETTPSRLAPFRVADIERFREVQEALQHAFGLAAARAGVGLLRASALSRDHGLGSREPWIFGYREAGARTASFHPNALAMRHIADALVELTGRTGAPS